MMSYFLFINIIVLLMVCESWSQRPEQIIVEYEQSFSLDCKQDESVYFARRLGQWSDLRENTNQYSYLNLKFDTLPQENILRLSTNFAELDHVGYYGCRKPTWATASMSRIYQLILADVQSFYWTYTCHGSAGSCQRSDDSNDRISSTFEVADQTYVDLFCCASATGYKNININMNQIGENRGPIDVKRKQELDGSWVVCATQHTFFTKKSSSNQQTLKCELTTNDQPYSTLSSVIVIKDAMPVDPDLPNGYTPPPRDGDVTYFDDPRPSNAGKRGRLSTAKKIAIIVGSVVGGLLLLGLVLGLIVCLCCKKKASKDSKLKDTHDYAEVNTYDQPRNPPVNNKLAEEENPYLEPTHEYYNSPVKFRV